MLQCGRSAYQLGHGGGQIARDRWGGTWSARDRQSLFRPVLLPDGPAPQQPIPPAGDGHQHVTVRAERLADRGNMELERILLDGGALPGMAEEVALGDELAGRMDQALENVEGPASKRDWRAMRAQLATGEIDLQTT